MELAERNGILRGHESFVYDVAFSPDGARAASAAWDGTVRIWDATTGRQTASLRHDGDRPPANIVSSVAWHPDGSRLASVTRGDSDHPLGSGHRPARPDPHGADRLLGRGRARGLRPHGDAAWPRAAGTAPCASGTCDTGEPAGVLHGHAGAALDVAFSPDGSRLASVGYDGTVRVWDAATRSAIRVLSGEAQAYRIAYSPDGRLIAVCSLRGNVRLWDARDYRELAVLPHGEPGARTGLQPGGHPPGDGLRRQYHPPMGPRHPAGGLRAAGARGLCPRRRLQPGRDPAGFGLRAT